MTRREQLHRFLTWLTGKHTQAEIGGGTGRSFRDQTAWCWELQPRMPVTGEVHDAVLVDGIWIGSWCLLIALSDTGHVIAWQWAARESTAAWEALFDQFPPLEVVVTDGGSGIRSALAMNLSTVDTVDAAINWRLALEGWWQRFGHLTKERTLYLGGGFGYTHDRLRKAWGILHRAAEAGHVFTFLDHGNPRTTSPLEGGINAQIRHLLRHHRGMTIEHRRRAIEWFLLLREVPLDLAHQHTHIPVRQPRHTIEEPIGPELYGTGLDPTEGLWHRSGWIGEH